MIENRGQGKDEAVDYLFYLQEEYSQEVRQFAERLLIGTVDHLDALDQEISARVDNWALNRLAPIDRNILRLALFELQYCEDIPQKVSMNEAIELAKRYGDEKSSLFVNGVLDANKGSQTAH